jgi:tetratricopeptide (TPR) repeat protein
MTERGWVRRALEEAMMHAGASENNSALACLERGLRTARELRDNEAISSLARHAGLQSYHLRDFQRSVAYYREALTSKPIDGWLYLALAEAYDAMGEAGDARQALADALATAVKRRDHELEALIREKQLRSDIPTK